MAAEAFPAGDPRNALYAENLAALEHARTREQESNQEGRNQARAKATYRQGLLGQAEPEAFKANQDRANAGGILESGINAKRRGGIAADYANKRFTVTSGLKEYEEGSQRREKSGQERYEEARAKAGTKALSEAYESMLKNPQSEAPTPGAAPGASFWNPGYGPQYQTYPTGTYKNPAKRGR